MNTWKKYLGIVAVLMAVVLPFAAAVVLAGTDAFDANTGGVMNTVGGIPLCVTFSGTDGGSGALTITLPTGFTANYAMWVENVTAGAGGSKQWFWVKGMSADTAMLTDTAGTDGFSQNADADIDAATAGSFVIDDDAITDNKAYYGFICR